MAPRSRTSHDQRINVPLPCCANVTAPTVCIAPTVETEPSRMGRTKSVNSVVIVSIREPDVEERAEIRDLKRELGRVSRERDILAKAVAFFSASTRENG